MTNAQLLREAGEQGNGVYRLIPTWVPRPMLRPGGRLRLHPADLFALGGNRGGICERWIASAPPLHDVPGTPEGEGASHIEWQGQGVPLSELTGDGWSVRGRLVDSAVRLPFHVHAPGEAEGLYFPVVFNSQAASGSTGYFGLQAHTSLGMIQRSLRRWNTGDNGILRHALGYRLYPGTGWQIEPGVLHSPGTLVSYSLSGADTREAIFESQCAGDPLPWDVLGGVMPEQHRFDMDYILGWLDLGRNTDPFFGQYQLREPVRAGDSETYLERWIVYGTESFSALEVAVAPGEQATLRDPGQHGLFVVQGRGHVGVHDAEAPGMIRFGQMTQDEFFVSAAAAAEGVILRNASRTEPLVVWKQFGPGHPGAKELVECKSE